MDTCKATFGVFGVLKHCGGARSSHQIPKGPCRAMSEQRHLPGMRPHALSPWRTGWTPRVPTALQTPGNILTAQTAAPPQALSIFICANCFCCETHPPWARGGRRPPGTGTATHTNTERFSLGIELPGLKMTDAPRSTNKQPQHSHSEEPASAVLSPFP